MNHSELEQRLKDDAGALSARCPDDVRHRVRSDIARQQAGPARRRIPGGWPSLAAACALTLAVAITWMLVPSAPEPGGNAGVDLQADPVMTDPDRLLAAREAILENEWQSLERDLRALRQQVTLNFQRTSNG